MMDYEMEIRSRVSTMILESDYSLKALSKLLNISYNTMALYVSKKVTPSSDRLGRICKALGISADWVLGIKEERE